MSSAFTITEIAAGVAILGGANAMTGGAISNALGFGPDGSSSGVYGSGDSTVYDPYGPYRNDAAKQLNTLVNNPTAAMGDAGYQGQLNAGIQATERAAASKGMLLSGNEQAALQTLGQNTFGSYYNAKLANLMQLSGASQNPAAAGQAATQAALANAQMQNASANMFNAGIGGITGGLKSIYGNPSGTTYDMNNISGPNNFSGFDVNSTTTPGFWQDFSYD